MKNYMITMPRKGYGSICRILQYIWKNDIKKWIIGAEEGRGGYKHWQIRMEAREGFCEWEERQVIDWSTTPARITKVKVGTGWINTEIPEAHVEECSDTWDYETKEGKFIASWDTPEVRKLRFGKMRWPQECAVKALESTNDRQVVFWYDPKGNSGKSWLCGHLYETGQAYYLPPTLTTVQSMLQTMASLAWEDRKAGRPPRRFVIIDLPRSWKWSKELYCAIETIKDGLIMDPRYSARPIDIRGIKVLVLTNERPKLDSLSEDRWVEYNAPMF